MSIFGRFYRVMTFGESHASHVGCVIEGFPSNFKVSIDHIQRQLNRRRPGQSILTTTRDQKDRVSCISGLQNDRTLGSPLCFIVANQNTKKKDYAAFSNVPRPGHADFTYLRKYGIKAESGGGRSSARETIGRVIAGALAEQFLATKGITFASYVSQIANISIPQSQNQQFILQKIDKQQVDRVGQLLILNDGKIVCHKKQETDNRQKKNYKKLLVNEDQSQNNWEQVELSQHQIKQIVNLRCPYPQASVKMYHRILQAKKNHDSLGGIVQGCIYGLPTGLGEPIFDKLPAVLAHSMISLPATKGFQFGKGFRCVDYTGSTHNDMFKQDLSLKTNNSGGSLGGISSGQTFYYRVAFKPVSSIAKVQETHDFDGKFVKLETKGRHDPCVLPRAPPLTDSMAAMTIMELYLAQKIHQI